MWLQNLRNWIKIPGFGRYWRGLASRLRQTANVKLYHVIKFPLYLRLRFIISTHNLVVSRNFLSTRIVLSCFYLLIFYFKKFLPWIKRLLFAEYVKHIREVTRQGHVEGCAWAKGEERKEKRESSDYSTVQTWKHHLSLTCLHMFKSTSVTSKPSLTLDKPCTRKNENIFNHEEGKVRAV